MRTRFWMPLMAAAAVVSTALGVSAFAAAASSDLVQLESPHPKTFEAEVAGGVLAVRGYGPAAHPDVYAGVDTSDPRGTDILVIYLTTDDTGVRADFVTRSGLPDSAIAFRTVPYSEAQLDAVNSRLRTDYDALRTEGFEIRGWGIATDRRGEEVAIANASPEQLQLLQDRYGPGLIFVDPDPTPVQSFVLPLVNGELRQR